MPHSSWFRPAGWAALAAAVLLTACAAPGPRGTPADPRLARIGHVVVIYAENHSFDNMYGLFPGAEGIADATPGQYLQRDHDGSVLPELVVFGHGGKPDPQFPRLPNKPFRIDAPPVNRPPTQLVPSPIHAFFHNREQIDGGRNDLFAAMSNVGGWVMGYYDGSQFRLWKWAQEYTLADHFFMGAFGGSYLNHQYLVCACAPRHPDAPASMRARLDAQGRLEKKPGSPSAREGAAQVFTLGQVTRMRATLLTQRSGFLTSDKCGSLSSVGNQQDKNIRIYPNPVTNYLYIENLPQGRTAYTVEVVDELGRVIKTTAYTGSFIQLEVSDLFNGYYVVRVFNDERFATEKVLILH